MSFFKKLLLTFFLVCFIGFLAVVWFFWSLGPFLEPCEPFETDFGSYSLRFPIEGSEARQKFGGMVYDSLPPYFLHRLRNDTLVQAHFRSEYNAEKFNNPWKEPDLEIKNSSPYDTKGIYCYSFMFNSTYYPGTLLVMQKRYGNQFESRTSSFDKVSYLLWPIGPCHKVLLFRKKTYTTRYNLNPDQEYTYVMFIYNLTEKEINDVVEADGFIRNESIY